MRHILLFVSFISFFLPSLVLADIVVTEIAWMGTSISANDEWIEIRNTGSSSVSLSGWTLNASDGTPSINLSGSISSGSYELLERTDDSSEPSVPALVIFTGALGNEGEELVLKNSSGDTIQTLNFSSGWTAGDSTSRQTMQWSGSGWVTGEATPGSGYSGAEEEEEEENTDDEDEEDETDDVSVESSSSSTAKTYSTYSIEILAEDSSVPVGSPVKFSLKTRDLNGTGITRGSFFWNMGDGTERFYGDNKEFSHVYDHEGTYVVSLRYYKTHFEEIDPDATDKITITINNSSVSISKIHSDGGVEIKNTSQQEIDLSGWKLKDGSGKTFVIPDGTFILPNKSIVFGIKRTKFSIGEATLTNPSGGFVDNFSVFAQTKTPSVFLQAVSKKTSSNVGEGVKEVETISTNNLNDRLSANVSSVTKQKQLPVWVIVFVILIVGSAVSVYLIYRKDKKENITEDEFELLD